MSDTDMSRMPPSLSPEVQALLNHERAISAQPEVMRARVLARARIALQVGEGLAPLSWRTVVGTKRWLIPSAAASLVLAAGVAAAFQIMRSPASAPEIPRNSAPRVAPSEPMPTPAVQEPGSSDAVGQQPTAVRQGTPGAALRRVASAARADNLREELSLLDRARQQEARRNFGAVLDTIAEHERDFGTGRLIEEREVIRVKALVGLGRADAARKAVARFHRQFPRSVLSQTIDEAVSSPM